MMVIDRQNIVSEIATPSDYRRYFGVPPKTITTSEFLRWAQSVSKVVTIELDGTTLTSHDRDVLRSGLATALKVLSGHYAGAVLR